jgi:hypothetical protein
MSDDRRMPPNNDSRPGDRRGRDGNVLPIGDVLAELLDQYQVRFPGVNVTVIEEPSPMK